MNGVAREIRTIRGRLLLCAAAGLTLSACVSVPKVEPYADAPVDPNSSAAAAIQAQAAAPTAYPTFADIPPAPTDVRSAEGWRMAVAGTEADRDELLRDVAPSTFSLRETEGFAERMRALLGFDPSDIPTAGAAAETEAWASRMRERATPPPRPR